MIFDTTKIEAGNLETLLFVDLDEINVKPGEALDDRVLEINEFVH